ncbi:MAG: hypothetical protein ABWY20_23020 [Mycobacterium sp.]
MTAERQSPENDAHGPECWCTGCTRRDARGTRDIPPVESPERVCPSCSNRWADSMIDCPMCGTVGHVIPLAESCLCRDPLREVHPGCALHGHSPESVFPPEGTDR